MSKRSKIITDRIVRGLSELSEALKRGDKISETFACRKIMLNLRPLPYSAESVKSTRKLLRVSQSIFAQFLGVKTGTVRSWEQGRQPPSDMACRFMDEIQRNPEYYRKRVRESVRINEKC